MDYDFDWFVIEYEYCQNPEKGMGPNSNDRIYLEYCELLMQAKEAGLGYRAEDGETLHLVPTPLVRINELNQWHSDSLPSIRWKGGEEFFFLNGVNFPKPLWEKVTSGEMPFQDILAIEDIDQRTQAMKFGDVDSFLEHSKAELLDTAIKRAPRDVSIIYRLHKIPLGEIFTQVAYYVAYMDPSTGKKYMSGVEPFKTVRDAMAWKSGITPEQWQSMVPLVHEA